MAAAAVAPARRRSGSAPRHPMDAIAGCLTIILCGRRQQQREREGGRQRGGGKLHAARHGCSDLTPQRSGECG